MRLVRILLRSIEKTVILFVRILCFMLLFNGYLSIGYGASSSDVLYQLQDKSAKMTLHMPIALITKPMMYYTLGYTITSFSK